MSSKYCLLTLETNFDTNIKLEIKKKKIKSCFSFFTFFQSNNVGMLIENRKTTFFIYVTKYVNRGYYTGLLLLFCYHLKNICTAQQHLSLFIVNLCIIVCMYNIRTLFRSSSHCLESAQLVQYLLVVYCDDGARLTTIFLGFIFSVGLWYWICHFGCTDLKHRSLLGAVYEYKGLPKNPHVLCRFSSWNTRIYRVFSTHSRGTHHVNTLTSCFNK